MKTIILEIPESVNLDAQEAKNMLAARLYENGTLSLGQAAELAGYSKRTFMDMLGQYGVSLFNQSVAELEKDILNAKKYRL